MHKSYFKMQMRELKFCNDVCFRNLIIKTRKLFERAFALSNKNDN